MTLKTIKEIKTLKNKRVLLRCDFNAPLKARRKKARVANSFKIDSALPTIHELQNQGAIIIIASHLGRPGGRVKKQLSLFPVAKYLSKKLRQEIIFVQDCLDPDFSKATSLFKPGEIILLENLRFHIGEEKNSPAFAKKLGCLADIYINEAFANSHRSHASMLAITKHLSSYAGLNLEQEVGALTQILEKPQHPTLIIIGGKKIKTKISVIENLIKKLDLVILGGAVANNFIKATGYEVGKSIIDKDYLKSALSLLNHKKFGKKIMLPFDVRVGGGMASPRKSIWRRLDQIKQDEYILDIGPRTSRLYSKFCRHAKIIIWNGPLGYYESPYFSRGTYRVARAVVRSRATSIVGGGETLDILKRLRLTKKISFISTGGGAMLEFLAGKDLPGIRPLLK